ncbi:unnamed protein product, partial [Pocillopora meandrina]
TKLNESGKFFRDWGTHTDTLDIASTGLLQQELDTKLQFWKTKQQEVVAKLSILQKTRSTQRKSRIMLLSINRMPTKIAHYYLAQH